MTILIAICNIIIIYLCVFNNDYCAVVHYNGKSTDVTSRLYTGLPDHEQSSCFMNFSTLA